MSTRAGAVGAEHGLAALQRWLFEQVTRVAPGGVERGDPGGLVRAGGSSAAERVEIYRRAYRARLIECLRDDYPAVEHVLGGDAFEAWCSEFIATHAPASASLNFYGAPFAAFCAKRSLPPAACVADLARLEWAIVETIHADAETRLDVAQLGELSEAEWSRSRLVPSPALRLLRTAYPVHACYRAFLAGEHVALPGPAAAALAICRGGDEVWRVDLGPALADLLGELMQGKPLLESLGAVEGKLASDVEDVPALLQRTFSDWVACGFFAAVAI